MQPESEFVFVFMVILVQQTSGTLARFVVFGIFKQRTKQVLKNL